MIRLGYDMWVVWVYGRDLGHATRCVVRDPSGRKKLLMFAECANMQVRQTDSH